MNTINQSIFETEGSQMRAVPSLFIHMYDNLIDKKNPSYGGIHGRVVRTLICSVLNHCHLTAVGLSLAEVTCETCRSASGCQVVFLGDLTFLSHLPIDSAQKVK